MDRDINQVTLQCAICQQVKATNEFHRDSKMVSGFKSACKSCRAEKWQQYSKKIVRNYKEYDEYRAGLVKVGQPPCEQDCALFAECSNACQTCSAFRRYAEENTFSINEIAVSIEPCR